MFRNELISKILIILYYIYSSAAMEGNIIGGQYANIKDFPHAAALIITCAPRNRRRIVCESVLCGGSILNQNTLLTAAHCFEHCLKISSNKHYVNIKITVGRSNRHLFTYKTKKFKVHESYNHHHLENDIALVYAKKPFILGDNVKRVILPGKPVMEKIGYVAYLSGWGNTLEEGIKLSDNLKSLQQMIMTWNECQNYVTTPKGTICGILPGRRDRADVGDSGGGLMVYNIFEVGIVSYKPKGDVLMTIYTDVFYFLDWIKNNTKELFCSSKKKKKTHSLI